MRLAVIAQTSLQTDTIGKKENRDSKVFTS
jgi:hypothetical protein